MKPSITTPSTTPLMKLSDLVSGSDRCRLRLRIAVRVCLCCTCMLLHMPQTANAETEPNSGERKTVRTPTLRENVYKTLSEVQKKAAANQTTEAIALLERLRSRSGLNSYEAAMMWKFYAFIYYSQENYDDAIQAYQNLLNQSDLPAALETEALYNLGQLYFIRDDYQAAIKQLERWFKVAPSPTPKAYVFLAQAYYQTGEYGKALKPAQNAVDSMETQGKVPQEDWYLLLRAIHFEQNNYVGMASVLEKLVKHYPKKSYWIQLSSIYGELRQEDKRLSALEIAYRQGLLDQEEELINLAQLFLLAKVPYKAAKVLGIGMKDGILTKNQDTLLLLSNAWAMAQEAEKALPILIQATELTNTGELDVRLGQTYYQLDQWEKAVSAFRQGLEKGGLDQIDNAYLLLGLSYYNLDQLDDAIDTFRLAERYDDSKDEARRWIQHLEKEQRRRELLAQSMRAQ